jgi:glucokinase
VSFGALAIDIGGTKIAAAVVGPDGSVHHKYVVGTPAVHGAGAVLEAAVEAARRVLEAGRNGGIDIVAIGVGTGGHVDQERGTITYASDLLPGWMGLELGPHFIRALGLPVSVDNDVNSMALGEARFGAGRPFDNVLYVTVGTGVGGALVLGGRLQHGVTWTAGEVGHLVIDWDGTRRCSCGRLGHLEAFTSGPAIAERYRELAGLAEACDLRRVADRARNGDPNANTAIAEGAHILGLALSGLLNVLDPQALIIGGGVAELGDLWWSPLEAALRANPLPGPARIVVERAQLGVDAGLIGAAWMAFSKHTRIGASQ